MSFMKKFSVGVGVLALSSGVAIASPVSVSFNNVTGQDYQNLYDSFMSPVPAALRIAEDFSGYTAYEGVPTGGAKVPGTPGVGWNPADITAVGTFDTLGGTGNGQSVTNDPIKLQVRSGNNYGRFNPLSSDPGHFLDSNDTLGISWTISNTFDRLVRSVQAFITDPNDAGGILTVSLFLGEPDDTAGPAVWTFDVPGKPGDASVWHLKASNLHLVEWDTAVFNFQKNRLGDGIAISSPTVALIPLPAPVLMLLFGLGGLFGLRRFRRRLAA